MENSDTHRKVASFGLEEEGAKRRSYKILIGSAFYKDTGQGFAMGNPKGSSKSCSNMAQRKFSEDTFDSLREG